MVSGPVAPSPPMKSSRPERRVSTCTLIARSPFWIAKRAALASSTPPRSTSSATASRGRNAATGTISARSGSSRLSTVSIIRSGGRRGGGCKVQQAAEGDVHPVRAIVQLVPQFVQRLFDFIHGQQVRAGGERLLQCGLAVRAVVAGEECTPGLLVPAPRRGARGLAVGLDRVGRTHRRRCRVAERAQHAG